MASVLSNNVLGEIDFNLSDLVLKASWLFSNETDLTRILHVF